MLGRLPLSRDVNGDSQPRFSLAFCRRCATIAGLCLEVITHAPNPNDMMNLYTSFSWPTLCAEVAKLQVSLPERHTPHAVPTRSEPIVGRRAAAPEHGRPQQAQARETDQGPSSAARPHVLAGLLPRQRQATRAPWSSAMPMLQSPPRRMGRGDLSAKSL